MVALILTMVAQHAVYLRLCQSNGYVDSPLLLKQYVVVILLAASAYGLASVLLWLAGILFALNPLLSLATAVPLACVGLVIWIIRRRLPPVEIARKYGLLRK